LRVAKQATFYVYTIVIIIIPSTIWSFFID
jgi:hypothetical protein